MTRTFDWKSSNEYLSRAKKVSPDSVVAATGISKSKKTILNKTRQKEGFLFSGSKHVLDFLRKEGEGSVDSFLNDENMFKFFVAMKLNHLEGDKKESYW